MSLTSANMRAAECSTRALRLMVGMDGLRRPRHAGGPALSDNMRMGKTTKDKAKAIKAMRQIMTQFQQRNGATQCRLLKGVGTGKVLRECPLCVADAAEFLEEQLDKLTDQ